MKNKRDNKWESRMKQWARENPQNFEGIVYNFPSWDQNATFAVKTPLKSDLKDVIFNMHLDNKDLGPIKIGIGYAKRHPRDVENKKLGKVQAVKDMVDVDFNVVSVEMKAANVYVPHKIALVTLSSGDIDLVLRVCLSSKMSSVRVEYVGFIY